MVNREELRNELKQFGDIIFCDINNENSYVVVVENWTGTIENFETIANEYITPEYPNNITISLSNSLIKSEYTK